MQERFIATSLLTSAFITTGRPARFVFFGPDR